MKKYKAEECEHSEEDVYVKWIKTEVDERAVPRWYCEKCGKIGAVIYKVNPVSGKIVFTEG